MYMGFPGGSVVKNPPANAEDTGSIPGLVKIPWKWLPTSVCLPRESHGQRPTRRWATVHGVAKTSHMTEQLNNKLCMCIFTYCVNKYLLTLYYIPGTVPRPHETSPFWWGRKIKYK